MSQFQLSRREYLGTLRLAGDWWTGHTWPSSPMLPNLAAMARQRTSNLGLVPGSRYMPIMGGWIPFGLPTIYQQGD